MTRSAIAAETAGVPVPVADAVVLAPIQLAMMGRIAAIYDLELTTMMSAGALAQLGVQISGQALAKLSQAHPRGGERHQRGGRLRPHGRDRRGLNAAVRDEHTGKIDVSKVTDSWGDYAPGLLEVTRKMAERRVLKR